MSRRRPTLAATAARLSSMTSIPQIREKVSGLLREDSSPDLSRDASPEPGEETKLVSRAKFEKLTKKRKSSKKRSGFMFTLGSILGLLAAIFLAQRQEVISFEGLLDMNLDSIMDVIPSSIVKDAKDLTKAEREAVNYDSFTVGLHARSQGIKAHHPVIMIPGVISTGLESWSTTEKSRQYFRKRMWGSWSMMRALTLDQAEWKKMIMLDKKTGLDPPGVKLRAAQGFDAADFFITGYWIWSKILENLATIGYDPTNAFTAAYDWRLSYQNLEVRDQYFTRLKNYIEVAKLTTGKKATIVSHSMGGQVFFYFMKWVEHKDHGKGGPKWVDDYVGSWINVSGCMLGALKGMPAVLSGEMKDTAQLNAFAVYATERFLSRADRAEIFRAMPGISSMLPKGGEAVWGNKTWAPDDIAGMDSSFSLGTFLNFKPPQNSSRTPHQNFTIAQSIDYLLQNTEDWYADMLRSSYSHGVAHTKAEVEANEDKPTTWLNPLEARLPIAPNMKIYCFYGIGKPTERAYYYKETVDVPNSYLNITMDTGYTTSPPPTSEPQVDHGVMFGEGDGTVNLLSTGYVCSKGWRNITRYNPGKVKIVTYEMPHEPDRFSPRGGPKTGDHVDILGRSSLNDLILRVAGGHGDQIEDHWESKIWEIADRVKIYDEE